LEWLIARQTQESSHEKFHPETCIRLWSTRKKRIELIFTPRGERDISPKAIDALQSLVYITNTVQTECEGYAMLEEYESCKVCLDEFKTFIEDNRLDQRDTLLLLNENSSQKRIEIVDEFTDIAGRITALVLCQ
jgi:hypothetical protein